MAEKNELVRERLRISKDIAHYRKMIRRNYHPEFFKGLLVSQQSNQRKFLKREREQGLIFDN